MITDKYGRSITDSRVNDAREFYGLSTDTPKPTGKLANGLDIPNGAAFLEIDTGDLYLYDAENEEWNLLGGDE